MKKKGFTLIELMIVLAVIAILAVVLVPKAGVFKNNAKNAGVTTNVNTVRALLESKTGNNFSKDLSTLKSTLQNAFSTEAENADSNLVNPISNSYRLADSTTLSSNKQPAIYVDGSQPESHTDLKGSVVIIYTSNTSYTVYGVDNSGSVIDKVTINK